jgi:hypothetical protein
MSLPPVPQRPLPPVHHVWVAGPGDGRRLYRTTLIRTRHGVSASSLPLELFPSDALTFLQQRTAQSP